MKAGLLIAVLAISLFAAPSITGISGIAQHGRVVTITGNAFGTRLSGNPYVWDDLEDGTCNATAIKGIWGSTNLLQISNQATRGNFSSYAAHYNFKGNVNVDQKAFFTCQNAVLSEKWFIQYWVFLDTNWEWGTIPYTGNNTPPEFLANVKWLRLWNPGSTNENFFSQFWWSVNENSFSQTENVSGGGNANFSPGFSKGDLVKGQWHCLQFEFKDSHANGSADAEFRFWHNGVLKNQRTGFVARANSALKRPFMIGFYNAIGAWGPGNGHDNDYYEDDIYVDTTWARVEIGNAATYSACTHREIQIPAAWADGSISITVNQGDFAPSSDAFLYVVDANGNANASGYPVTFAPTSIFSKPIFDGKIFKSSTNMNGKYRLMDIFGRKINIQNNQIAKYNGIIIIKDENTKATQRILIFKIKANRHHP